MKHFRKNNHSKSKFDGIDFPDDTLEKVGLYFNDHFSEIYPHSMDKKSFHTYGKIFSDEILLIVSLAHDSEQLSPVSLFLSKEIKSEENHSEQKIKKTIDLMVEMAGIFFDEMLSTKDWNNYNLQWCEEEYKNEMYYAKTTRENIDATLKANELLGEDFDDNFDEDYDSDKNVH